MKYLSTLLLLTTILNNCKTNNTASESKDIVNYVEGKNLFWATEYKDRKANAVSLCRGECEDSVDLAKMLNTQRLAACSKKNISHVRISREEFKDDKELTMAIEAMASPKLHKIPADAAMRFFLVQRSLFGHSDKMKASDFKEVLGSDAELSAEETVPCVIAAKNIANMNVLGGSSSDVISDKDKDGKEKK